MANLLPVTITTTIAESDPFELRRHVEMPADSAHHGDAQLHVNWEGHIQFVCPGTWTQEERELALRELSTKLVRTSCMLIIQSLPQPVVVGVFPQLQELAEHELQVWRVRQQMEEPDLVERRVLLPVKR